MSRTITLEEFLEKATAKFGERRVAFVLELEDGVKQCDCDNPDCEGWTIDSAVLGPALIGFGE